MLYAQSFRWFFAKLFAFAPGSISWEISMPAVPYPPEPQNEQVLCVKWGDEVMTWISHESHINTKHSKLEDDSQSLEPASPKPHPHPLLPDMAKATFKGTKSSCQQASCTTKAPRCALPCTCIQIGSNCSHFSHSLNQSSVFSCAQRTRRLGRRDIRQRGIAFQHESQVYFHRRTRKERHPIIVQCDKQNALKHLTGNSVHGSDMAFRPFFLLDRRLVFSRCVNGPWESRTMMYTVYTHTNTSYATVGCTRPHLSAALQAFSSKKIEGTKCHQGMSHASDACSNVIPVIIPVRRWPQWGGLGWGGVGMMTFLAHVHIFDATGWWRSLHMYCTHLWCYGMMTILAHVHIFDALATEIMVGWGGWGWWHSLHMYNHVHIFDALASGKNCMAPRDAFVPDCLSWLDWNGTKSFSALWKRSVLHFAWQAWWFAHRRTGIITRIYIYIIILYIYKYHAEIELLFLSTGPVPGIAFQEIQRLWLNSLEKWM